MATTSGAIQLVNGDTAPGAGDAGTLLLYFRGGVLYRMDSTGAETAAAVQSFNGRAGAVTPQQADYDQFFLTPAEGNSMYDTLGAASSAQSYSVQRANHTGTQTSSTISDFATAAAAAAPVSSVNGKTGAVVTGYSASSNGSLPAAQANTVSDVAYATISLSATQAAALLAGATFSAAIYFTQSSPVTTNPSITAKLRVNGTAVASATLATGTTAQTNRPCCARLEMTFRAVGASGAAIGGAELTANGVAPVVAVGTATTAVNTNAALTIDVALAWSAAATGNTLSVYEANIEQVA